MAKTLSFPENFLWGSATSAYQVEGNNTNSDWYDWEEQSKVPYHCGMAADSYHRFPEDFDLIKTLGQNTHRLSIEWARIEPAQNSFNENEIRHYKEVLTALKKRDIKVVLTLHHFTNPLWFYNAGCWLNRGSVGQFAGYVQKLVKEFSELVDYWITINEPLVYIYNSYLSGVWPPGEKSLPKARAALENLAQAHCQAYDIIHRQQKEAKVSFAHHMRIFSPCPFFNLGQNMLPAWVRNRLFNFQFLEDMARKKSLDFIGLNYYAQDFVKFSLANSFGASCTQKHHQGRENSLNWSVFPEGLLKILISLKRFNLPALITENGTTENSDALYEDYLKGHLYSVTQAIEQGAKVIGYLWWSLLDNFEWEKGFNANFGLVAIDRDFKRKIKPFAYVYRDICTKNRIEYA